MRTNSRILGSVQPSNGHGGRDSDAELQRAVAAHASLLQIVEGLTFEVERLNNAVEAQVHTVSESNESKVEDAFLAAAGVRLQEDLLKQLRDTVSRHEESITSLQRHEAEGRKELSQQIGKMGARLIQADAISVDVEHLNHQLSSLSEVQAVDVERLKAQLSSLSDMQASLGGCTRRLEGELSSAINTWALQSQTLTQKLDHFDGVVQSVLSSVEGYATKIESVDTSVKDSDSVAKLAHESEVRFQELKNTIREAHRLYEIHFERLDAEVKQRTQETRGHDNDERLLTIAASLETKIEDRFQKFEINKPSHIDRQGEYEKRLNALSDDLSTLSNDVRQKVDKLSRHVEGRLDTLVARRVQTDQRKFMDDLETWRGGIEQDMVEFQQKADASLRLEVKTAFRKEAMTVAALEEQVWQMDKRFGQRIDEVSRPRDQSTSERRDRPQRFEKDAGLMRCRGSSPSKTGSRSAIGHRAAFGEGNVERLD